MPSEIPTAKSKRLAAKFHQLKMQILALELEAFEIKEELEKHLGTGKYENVTVYTVKGHHVPSYWVPEYKAIRANKTR